MPAAVPKTGAEAGDNPFCFDPPARPPGARLIVAFSGGVDSTVLLHALAASGFENLAAVHVHHGLQAEAEAWAAHCQGVCAALAVPLLIHRVSIDAHAAAGPEAAAREARYAALRSAMRDGDVLVTAHHRDDQAETLLLRLLRGSGVQGLASMRALAEFAPGLLWRPLLEYERESLLAYARHQQLAWIDDPQNVDPRYARSWLRAELMPRLSERFPGAVANIARAAALSAEASQLLDELAALDLAEAADGQRLRVDSLLALSPARRHQLLRYWLRQCGFACPSAETLLRIDREVLLAARDAQPLVTWEGCELRRHGGLLYTMRPLPPLTVSAEQPPWLRCWEQGRRLDLPPGCGWLEADTPPPRPLAVRLMREGEKLRIAAPGAEDTGRSETSRSLKNLFQEARVPPWVRVRTPVIEIEGETVYVGGIGGSQTWHALCAATSWKLRWVPANRL